MRWLRRFFYSDDPIVMLVGALSEPEAEMWRELLAEDGLVAMVKYTGALGGYGYRGGSRDFDLFVKQSDLTRARQILAPKLDPGARIPGEENGGGGGSEPPS